MENLKQYLIEEIVNEIRSMEEEIKKSDEDISILEARIKVEKTMLNLDLPEKISEDTKYSVEALEGMLMMEKNHNEELKKDFEAARYRKKAIEKFEEGEL